MKHIILGLAALAISAAASAENYIGGTIGSSRVEIDCGLAASCDDSDTGFKIYGGLGLAAGAVPGFALEASYIDFGKSRASTAGLNVETIEVSALTFGVAAHPKFTSALSGVGRIGLAYVDAKRSGLLGSSSSSNAKIYAGLGLEYAVSRQLKIVGNADFTSYDTGNDSGNAQLYSIGLQYGF